ncbi:MAG TPA: TonB-dependent receptor [Sphingobium sp.]
MLKRILSGFSGVSVLALMVAASSTVQARTADAADAGAAAADADSGEAIVVTGTRVTGLKAADSAAPVQVVTADVLAKVGQPSLTQALNQIVPSFTAQAFGGDASNLTLTAKLRGLSPNHALVLVNGKRRHPSANFHVSSGPFQGGFAPDLDLIPPQAIERVEVLTDGAAAQYGSDAIAGVINIILKSDRKGGSFSATAGENYSVGGRTVSTTGRLAIPLGENGFIDATGFFRFHDTTQLGGGDRRVANINGVPVTVAPTATNPGYGSLAGVAGFPNLNPIVSDAKSYLATGVVNAGYDFGGIELYGNATAARRVAIANEQYRAPNIVFRPLDGRTLQPGEAVSNNFILLYPNGFVPHLRLTEEDYAVSGGLRGEVSGWHWDASATYGRDRVKLQTVDSGNVNLYQDFGYTPKDFDDGGFIGTQLTLNLDVVKGLEVGLAKPLNVAVGAEWRRDSYEIFAGEYGSYYRTGAQSFPGFQPSSAGVNSRKSWSLYGDVTAYPTENWSISAAGRYEKYTDIGSTTIGKLTTRYDFSPAFALRGTVSTGFRAPSLGESYYRAISVSPTSETVQVAANSPAARLLGYQPLKPEKSTNFSVGVVAHPVPAVTITLDVYQIKVRDRIASTGAIQGLRAFTVVNQAVLDAIASIGREYDKTVPQVGIQTFTNAFNTRTQGIDLVVSATQDVGFGKVNWSLNGTYGKTKVTSVNLPATSFTPTTRGYIETAQPKFKVGLGALLTAGQFSANLRETIYGASSVPLSPDGANYYTARIPTAAITDLELGYKPSGWLELNVGASNLFNKKAPDVPYVPGSSATSPTSISGSQVFGAPLTFGGYGINGGYYYARVGVTF